MTREAVSAAKPAVRAQAKTEKVHGAASAVVLKGLVYGAAVLTFAVLLFLIGYILVTGIPHLKPSLFQWNYTSENVSMMPAILTTVETTALALLLAVPLGLFTAVYLNEYAKRGNKLVNVIRITTETLSGIPSITVAAVVITGILGAVISPLLIKMFKVKDPAAAGVSIGTCSHAVGTSKAVELGEIEGAMSGISIGISGIITVILALILF